VPCGGSTDLGGVAGEPRAAGARFPGRWPSASEQVEIKGKAAWSRTPRRGVRASAERGWRGEREDVPLRVSAEGSGLLRGRGSKPVAHPGPARSCAGCRSWGRRRGLEGGWDRVPQGSPDA